MIGPYPSVPICETASIVGTGSDDDSESTCDDPGVPYKTSVTMTDIERMRDAVFFDGPEASRKFSRFWILLALASIIASAGVVADSTATVIGAMIVAPLMIPILGTMLGVVLGDRANLLRSIAAGHQPARPSPSPSATSSGLLVAGDVVAATNSQVAGRVNPRLIDLLAALATGAVGSVALIRSDISDTLPGVAIAISLVPPLAVVGLCAESGAYSESAGALLLFGTNVAAILATGLVVMAIYRVHRLVVADASPERKAVNRRNAVLVVVAFVIVIGVPLTSSTLRIAQDTADEASIRSAANTWADEVGWKVADVDTTIERERRGALHRPVTGARTPPRSATVLEAEGADPDNVVAEFVFEESVPLGDEQPRRPTRPDPPGVLGRIRVGNRTLIRPRSGGQFSVGFGTTDGTRAVSGRSW